MRMTARVCMTTWGYEMLVIARDTLKILSDEEILAEVNRDRSEGWWAYDMNDLRNYTDDVLDWIDEQYFIVSR